MVLKRLVDFFTSLRLTVMCLSMAMVLVFVGTLAQVEIGLYEAQARYFRSLFVFWSPPGTSLKIPVWPGGYLLGTVLLVNLLAAHFKRFTLTKKKIGIFFIHAGLILLLLGQFFTEVLQVESSMRLEEGQTKNYSEDTMKNELAIVDLSHPDHNRVVSVPESLLVEQGEVRHPDLPFRIQLKKHFVNSWWGGNPGNAEVMESTQGIGQRLKFNQVPPTAKMNEENIPSMLVEVVTDEGSLGTWTVSNWLTKPQYHPYLQEHLGSQLFSACTAPQIVEHGGRSYEIALRPVRYYKPQSITLHDFRHDRYIGTEVAKNFSSRIQLRNPETGEDREVLIYMNNPLRYGGETYYQGSFERGDRTSILHVVRNPAWLTPYVSCTLVGLGLLVQFSMHLFGFAKKVSAQPQGQPSVKRSSGGKAAPGLNPASAVPQSVAVLEASAKRRNV